MKLAGCSGFLTASSEALAGSFSRGPLFCRKSLASVGGALRPRFLAGSCCFLATTIWAFFCGTGWSSLLLRPPPTPTVVSSPPPSSSSSSSSDEEEEEEQEEEEESEDEEEEEPDEELLDFGASGTFSWM